MACICILISIVFYLLFMVGVGLWYTRRNTSADDFYLGGRKLGPYVTAMSAEASDMSSWLLMGLPGLAFFNGLADPFWTAAGLALGTYLNWLLVAKRLRCYSAELGAITVPEFFTKRFGDRRRLLQGLAALVILVFFVPYTASGFAACGKLFGTLFGASYVPAMLISAIVIVAYTTCGGFKAASVTSFIQSLIMIFALVVVMIFGVSAAGGWDSVFANAREIPGYLSLTASTNIQSAEATSYSTLTIFSLLAWALGYFGMPHVLIHFMAAEDENKIKVSRRVGTAWVVISLAVAVLIGIIGFAMASNGSIKMFDSSSSAESLIVSIASLLGSKGVLLAILAGVILAGILSATMSTADVQLLAAASGIAHNIINDVLGIKLSEKKSIIVARVTVICVAVLGFLFALDPNSSVFRIVSFAWAGFGATFGPVMLFGLFWKRCNKWGAIAGMVSGAAMVFIWKYAIAPMGGVLAIYELLPAFVISCVFIVAVSLLTKAPEAEIVAEFESVGK